MSSWTSWLKTFGVGTKWITVGLLVIGGFIGGVMVTRKIQSISLPQPPVVVQTVPGLAKETAKRVSKEPSLWKKVSTEKIPATSVSVSSDTLPQSTLSSLPFGIVEVEKEGQQLKVSTLNYKTGESHSSQFVLPDSDRDFEIRAGATPPVVRADRNFGVRFGGDIRLSVPLVSTSESVAVALSVRGPVQFGTNNLSVAPYGYVDSGGHYEAGASLQWKF